MNVAILLQPEQQLVKQNKMSVTSDETSNFAQLLAGEEIADQTNIQEVLNAFMHIFLANHDADSNDIQLDELTDEQMETLFVAIGEYLEDHDMSTEVIKHILNDDALMMAVEETIDGEINLMQMLGESDKHIDSKGKANIKQTLSENDKQIIGKLVKVLKTYFHKRSLFQQNNLPLSVAFNVPNHVSLFLTNADVRFNEQIISRTNHDAFNEFQSLLSSIQSERDLAHVAPKILKLLEQWSHIADKFVAEEHSTSEKSRMYQLWNELTTTFHKRHQLASGQTYNRTAKVTSADIIKWLQPLITKNLITHISAVGTEQNFQPSLSMSPLEQYVIYMNANDNSQTIEQQLMNQLRQVIKNSQFLSPNNGVNQLAMALKPDNLGDMFVRFIEMNGEMTVKITVSSQATKKMLEANIHQLKNMFSPHQVVIEKQEIDFDEIVKEDALAKEQNNDEEQQPSEDEEKQQDHQSEAKEDFQKILDEKV